MGPRLVATTLGAQAQRRQDGRAGQQLAARAQCLEPEVVGEKSVQEVSSCCLQVQAGTLPGAPPALTCFSEGSGCTGGSSTTEPSASAGMAQAFCRPLGSVPP